MPGIAGIISHSPAEKHSERLTHMVETMKFEVFYKPSTYFVPEMSVYAGLVNFHDSPGGIVTNESGTVVLALSGECFDTSEPCAPRKLIDWYEQDGEGMVKNLNGLFCGVLIDKERKKTFLFNDRYGMRRIYFHESRGNFYFASEAKALLRILPELREFDPEGVADFLAYGCTLDWRTLFRGIEAVPGGSIWTFESGRCRKERYFSPEQWESRPNLRSQDYEPLLSETFERVLPRYFEPHSKTGIALTGGLDTRMIMACRPKCTGQATCYTFSGNNGRTLDDKIAIRVAAVSNLEHHLLRLEKDFFSDFRAFADKTIFATDGCAGIHNTHETYFNQKARALASVRLTGNYGSEILRGFSSFKPLSLTPGLLNPAFGPVMEARGSRLSAHKTHPMTFAAFKDVPWHLYGNLAAGCSQLQFRTPYLDNELVELAFRAPESMRSSSLPSCRLVSARDPLLSHIPTDRGYVNGNSGLAFLSRRIFAEVTFKLDYYNSEGFPNALVPLEPLVRKASARLGLLGLHKFLHYRAWFQREFSGHVRDALTTARTRLSWFFEPRFLDTMAEEHVTGRKNYSLEINAAMTLEAIDRLLFRQLPT